MKPETNSWQVNLYNQKHAFVFEYGHELIQLLNPQKNQLILDLGCGSGQLSNEISKSGAKVIGIDSSKEMIANAKAHFPDIDFFIKDAVRFSFENQFDAIFSNAVLHWVLDAEDAILNMHNNLKTGGRIVLEFGGKGNVEAIVNSIKNNLKEKGYVKNASLKIWNFPSISEYTTLLEKNGFEVDFAYLYDRPTELADHQKGIIDWIEMFGDSFFKNVANQDKKQILNQVQKQLKTSHFKKNKWYADYKRIRILATKIV